jgi:hypothetical protein
MFARAYAQIMGYFWLPCPSCGVEFGGQQWRDINGHYSSIPAAEGDGIGICPTCTRAGVGCRAWAAVNDRPRKYHFGCEFVAVPP